MATTFTDIVDGAVVIDDNIWLLPAEFTGTEISRNVNVAVRIDEEGAPTVMGVFDNSSTNYFIGEYVSKKTRKDK